MYSLTALPFMAACVFRTSNQKIYSSSVSSVFLSGCPHASGNPCNLAHSVGVRRRTMYCGGLFIKTACLSCIQSKVLQTSSIFKLFICPFPMLYATPWRSVAFRVNEIFSFTPSPCGPFLSFRPIMLPCRQYVSGSTMQAV